MNIFVVFLLAYHFSVFTAVDLGSKLKTDLSTPKVRIVLGLDSEAKQKHLENLKTELHSFQQEWLSYQEQASQKAAELKKQIELLNNTTFYKGSSNIVRKINILHKIVGIIEEIKDAKLKIIELLQQNIEFLSKNISESSAQPQLQEEKSLYSFFEFQTAMKKYFLYEEQLRQMYLKKESLFQEITRQEHILATKEKDFNTIEQILDDKKKSTEINKDDISLLDVERDLTVKEREYASLKLILFQKQMEFLDSKESALQERVSSMTEQLKLIRSRLYIDAHEVELYEKRAIEVKKMIEAKSLDLQESKKQISLKKIEAQDEFDRVSYRYKISINNFQKFIDLDEDIRTVSDRFNLYSVGYGLTSIITFDRMIQGIKSQLDLFDVLFAQAQITSKAVALLYGITQGHTKASETFEKERADYKQFHQGLIGNIKKYKDMILLIHTQLKENQKYIEYLKAQKEVLQNSIVSLSSAQQKKWNDSLILLMRIIEDISKQHDVLLQIGENYEQMLQANEEALESVKTILQEFDTIGVWHRPMTAVTWDGISNIIPDIKLFLKNIYISITTYVSQLSMQKLAYDIISFGFGGIVTFFLLFFLIFMMYFFLQALFPSLYTVLISDEHDDTDPLYRWKQLFAICVGFCEEVFKPLYFWVLCFLYESFYDLPVALLILFYIYSIIFWIYASRKLLHVFFVVNRKFDYFLLNKRLIDKFSLVYSFFSVATIIILVMRKMFIIVFAHETTELPNILLRIYHVVIFISIIFSLDKDEIVQVISKRSLISQRLAQIIERYYYLFLLGVFSLLIMSDPYLGGYGSLVWHLFWNLFMTISIGGTLFIVQAVIRQYSSVFFFEEQEGTVPTVLERFEHAKTWYALYVIASMFLIMFIGIVACSHVWGFGITLTTLKKFALYELFKIEAVNATGKYIPESFKVYNLLYILIVSFLGVLIAYLFKKFVLKRLFDIQYVDPGIQNTVIIISRYVIIISFVMLACVQSKLGYLVTYVSYVALVVFGWSFKDLFTDFVAYFFILVQRPVKLGDYVKIDSDTMGVVRKVGPRAVILRRKNSVSIVVPNSTILKSALYNWNYTRSYIGLEDISFCVSFGTDIQLVKKICLEVLDEDQDILKVPQPFVRLDSFEDKGYLFMIRGFVSSGNTLRQWDIASNVRFNLVDKLSKAGVQIAGPSVKVLIKNSSFDVEKLINEK
jgi:small-conductance mechanosensitive channel